MFQGISITHGSNFGRGVISNLEIFISSWEILKSAMSRNSCLFGNEIGRIVGLDRARRSCFPSRCRNFFGNEIGRIVGLNWVWRSRFASRRHVVRSTHTCKLQCEVVSRIGRNKCEVTSGGILYFISFPVGARPFLLPLFWSDKSMQLRGTGLKEAGWGPSLSEEPTRVSETDA